MEQRAAANLMARGGAKSDIIGSGGQGSAIDAASRRSAISKLLGQASQPDYALGQMLGVGAQLEKNENEFSLGSRLMGINEKAAGIGPAEEAPVPLTNPQAVAAGTDIERAANPGLLGWLNKVARINTETLLPGGQRPSDDMAEQRLYDVLAATQDRIRSADGNLSPELMKVLSSEYTELNKNPAFNRAWGKLGSRGDIDLLLEIMKRSGAAPARKVADPNRLQPAGR